MTHPPELDYLEPGRPPAMLPRIFISVPDDRHLDARRQRIKRAILRMIASQGLAVVGFEPEQFGTGASKALSAWTVDRAQALLRQCDGLLVLALARRHVQLPGAAPGPDGRPDLLPLPTTYNHLEGAIGLALGLPLLVVMEQGMLRDGIFDSGIQPAEIPASATAAWASSRAFRSHLPEWLGRIQARRDVFLGYCSKGSPVALALRRDLEQAGHTVLDWARDFKPGGATIFDEIERAASLCRAAIFVFPRDDELAPQARARASFTAVPRDNVLFEAGYFMQVRGKARVAIVREAGTKMPADLDGVIYLGFDKRSQLQATKQGLRRFLAAALAGQT